MACENPDFRWTFPNYTPDRHCRLSEIAAKYRTISKDCPSLNRSYSWEDLSEPFKSLIEKDLFRDEVRDLYLTATDDPSVLLHSILMLL